MAEVLIKEGLILFPGAEGGPPRLAGSQCRLCGYCCFPPKQVCLKCLRDDCMEAVKLGPRARLETFAVTQIGTPDYPAPYIMAYVTTPEGARIFTLVAGCEPSEDELQIGQEMELVIGALKKDASGNDVIGWKFKPVKEGA